VFHDISANMQQVMRALEEQTARDQPSLRSVSVDVGRCLSLLAMSAPQGAFLELGSSGGYSSLWLSLAARARGVTLTTVDLDERKVTLARENISRAGAEGSVQVFHGDALDYATRFEEIAFCFSDIEPPGHGKRPRNGGRLYSGECADPLDELVVEGPDIAVGVVAYRPEIHPGGQHLPGIKPGIHLPQPADLAQCVVTMGLP